MFFTGFNIDVNSLEYSLFLNLPQSDILNSLGSFLKEFYDFDRVYDKVQHINSFTSAIDTKYRYMYLRTI